MFLLLNPKIWSGLKIHGHFELLSRHFFLCFYAYFTIEENNDVVTTVFNVTENVYFELKKTKIIKEIYKMRIVIRTPTVPGLVKKSFTFNIFGKYTH